MPILESQMQEDEAGRLFEKCCGLKARSVRLAMVIPYGELASEDRIYEVDTPRGRYWFVQDPAFGSRAYPKDGFSSADRIYAHHVALAAERIRKRRQTLSSCIEERAAPRAGDSWRRTKMANNKPFKTIRSGLVRAVIWKNAPKNGSNNNRDFYSIQLERIFKRTPEAQWEQTNSFGVNDLARVKLVVSEAFKELALAADDRPRDDKAGQPVVEEVKVE